jgi:excisionase family DNA binding protein
VVSDSVSEWKFKPTNFLPSRSINLVSQGVSPMAHFEHMFDNVPRCLGLSHLRSRLRVLACNEKGIGEKWKVILAHLYTTAEACKQLNISRSTLYRLISDGEIEPIKIRNCCRFSEANLNKYLDRQIKKSREEKVGF